MSEPILVRPDSELLWSHTWTDYLAEGVTISTRQWSINPDTTPTMLSQATSATVKATGFLSGKVYRLKEVVVLSNAEEESQEILIRCQ